MKKKVVLILIFFISLFIFSVDASAIQCVYKNFGSKFKSKTDNMVDDVLTINKDNKSGAITAVYRDTMDTTYFLNDLDGLSLGGVNCTKQGLYSEYQNYLCSGVDDKFVPCTDSQSCCPTLYGDYNFVSYANTFRIYTSATLSTYIPFEVTEASGFTSSKEDYTNPADDIKCSDRQNNAIYDEIDNLRKKYQAELDAISIPENATFEEYQTYESTFQAKNKEITDKIDSEQKAIIAKYNCKPSTKTMEKVKNSISQLMTFYNRRYNEYTKKLESLRGKTITDDEYKNLIDSAKKNKEQAEKKYKQVMINIEDLLKELAESNKTSNCKGILDDELVKYINMFLNWSRIAAPILLIILGSVDFSKAVIFQDKDDLKKATSTFTKRCVIAVAIFFIPTVLNVLVSIFNSVSDTPLTTLKDCGIK